MMSEIHQGIIYGAIVIAALLVLMLMLKAYNKAKSGKCHSFRSLKGKVVLITGANRGIGKEVALDIAMRGAKVIIACRNKNNGQIAADDIIRRTGNRKVVVQTVDLASLFSVRHLATEIIKKESRLDILIHNARIRGVESRTLTADNIELTFATNAIGPFMLTYLLLDFLKKSAPSSIIFVTSHEHKYGSIDFNNLNGETNFHSVKAYFNSKLAQVMYVKELAKRLVGSNVKVNAVHPGIVDIKAYQQSFFFARLFIYFFSWFFFKTPKQAAQPILHLAVSKDVENITGKYFEECKIAKESSRACDTDYARKLWEASEKMAKVGPFEC